MVTINREGTKVYLRVKSGLPVDKPVFLFDFECDKESFAELLTRQLNQVMQDKIREMRKESYEKGYNDHKKRLGKDDWFSGQWG